MKDVNLWPDPVPADYSPLRMVMASSKGPDISKVITRVCTYLVEEADKAGATDIYNFRFEMTEDSRGLYTIIGYGTAAKHDGM